MKTKTTTTTDTATPLITTRSTLSMAAGLLLGSILILAAAIVFPENTSR